MSKHWDDFLKELETEIKSELARNYYSEKLLMEETWEVFKEDLKDLEKKYEEVVKAGLKIWFLLGSDEIRNEFEKLTGFPLKELFVRAKEIFQKNKNWDEKKIQKELFQSETLPFAFTRKGKFNKFFAKVYQELKDATEAYVEEFEKFKKYYRALEKETEKFHRKFDISAILGFFEKLEDSPEWEGTNIEEARRELAEKLKVTPPPSVEESFHKLSSLPDYKEVSSQLKKLIEKLFKEKPEITCELFQKSSG